jgi:hypothetical protein
MDDNFFEEGEPLTTHVSPDEVTEDLKSLCDFLENEGVEGGMFCAVPHKNGTHYHSLIVVYGGVHMYPERDPKELN